MLLLKAQWAGKWQRNAFSDMGRMWILSPSRSWARAVVGGQETLTLGGYHLLQHLAECFWSRSESLHQEICQLFLACLAEGAVSQTVVH